MLIKILKVKFCITLVKRYKLKYDWILLLYMASARVIDRLYTIKKWIIINAKNNTLFYYCLMIGQIIQNIGNLNSLFGNKIKVF